MKIKCYVLPKVPKPHTRVTYFFLARGIFAIVTFWGTVFFFCLIWPRPPGHTFNTRVKLGIATKQSAGHSLDHRVVRVRAIIQTIAVSLILGPVDIFSAKESSKTFRRKCKPKKSHLFSASSSLPPLQQVAPLHQLRRLLFHLLLHLLFPAWVYFLQP